MFRYWPQKEPSSFSHVLLLCTPFTVLVLPKLQGEQKCKTLGTRLCGVQKNYAYSGSCSSSQKISSNRINTIERETTKTMITIKLTTIETIKTIVCFIQSRQLFYQVLRYPLFTLLFFLFFFLSLFILFCSPFFTFKLRENKELCVFRSN